MRPECGKRESPSDDESPTGYDVDEPRPDGVACAGERAGEGDRHGVEQLEGGSTDEHFRGDVEDGRSGFDVFFVNEEVRKRLAKDDEAECAEAHIDHRHFHTEVCSLIGDVGLTGSDIFADHGGYGDADSGRGHETEVHVSEGDPAGRHVFRAEVSDDEHHEDGPANEFVAERDGSRPTDTDEVSHDEAVGNPCSTGVEFAVHFRAEEDGERDDEFDGGSEERSVGGSGEAEGGEAEVSEDEDVVGADVGEIADDGGYEHDFGSVESEEEIADGSAGHGEY